MKRILSAVSIAILSFINFARQSPPAGQAPPVEKVKQHPRIRSFDARCDANVPKDAQLEKLADGFALVEGPVWDKRGNFLLFSDIPNNSIIKPQSGRSAPGGIRVFDPKDGKLLGVFEFDMPTANCNWGEDGSAFYITSKTAICRIRLDTQGANF